MVSQIAPVSLNRLAFLKKTNFFKGIEHEAFLEDLAAEMEEQTFAENEVVLHRGDRDQLIFFMIAGKVKIHVGDIKMAELSRGAHFGDIALFDNQPASASITAVQTSQCLVLHQSKLLATLEKYSEIRSELIAYLYQRQRKTQSSPWQTSAVENWCANVHNPSWAY
ncbi:cyclic nucleotide-binding domain-containing protein [Acaryochloris sp. IP29b_bin.137]|uniref:cyclic nucleotide-binding domain-containing protein n=1 Tax=Acaryochloris sp. IP29b_bin.137 TaxID=2969217 RepID=UPI00262434FD|nr:cyclic nucleotide-binding domain-containing protein [Acaryochloris sp. IP29b_bin.137]